MKDTSGLKQRILDHLQPGKRIGITTHVEPDGDGFCAALALQLLLRSRGLESEIVVDGNHLERFEFLMEGAKLRQYEPGLAYDLLFILDCNSYSRLGARGGMVQDSSHSILIDHHVAENGVIEADFSFTDTSAVSVGAILFHAFQPEIEGLPDEYRLPIGDCLYTTILNDSNNFTNANTTPETFSLAAGIAGLGINPSDLNRRYFLNHRPNEMRYVGQTLATIQLYNNGRILVMHSTLDMQKTNDLAPDSIMNMTRWVQGVKGVDAIAHFREDAPGLFKLSLRSPILDVNKIAVAYGGGGHQKASGAHLKGSLDEVRQDILNKLTTAIAEHDSRAGR